MVLFEIEENSDVIQKMEMTFKIGEIIYQATIWTSRLCSEGLMKFNCSTKSKKQLVQLETEQMLAVLVIKR